jgi:hypothetical protein
VLGTCSSLLFSPTVELCLAFGALVSPFVQWVLHESCNLVGSIAVAEDRLNSVAVEQGEFCGVPQPSWTSVSSSETWE